MPRYLARVPYQATADRADAFEFTEDVATSDQNGYTWANAAYLMAVNIGRSFSWYGWFARIRGIESGGDVTDLPTHAFPSDDGSIDTNSPTEIAISERRERELATCGLMPLERISTTDVVAFIGARSLHDPAESDDRDQTWNAALAARLPYLFACCRVAQYLKCIVRETLTSFKTRDQLERWLNRWVIQYVDGDPENSSDTTKANKPLAAAEVVIADAQDDLNTYAAQFYLRPHYQLGGLTASICLVSALPKLPPRDQQEQC